MEEVTISIFHPESLFIPVAIQKKAVGECTPTPVWSGLGFSQSTPDSAFRDRLRQNNVNTYTGPSNNTNTIYEVSRKSYHYHCYSL